MNTNKNQSDTMIGPSENMKKIKRQINCCPTVSGLGSGIRRVSDGFWKNGQMLIFMMTGMDAPLKPLSTG